MSLLPVAEAQARLLASAVPLPPVDVPLADAAARYAAVDIVARRTQPAADLSMMDGYAIRFDEMPGPWRVVGESRAGLGFAGTLAGGEAVRIFTGAPMPSGADAVLVQEEARREGTMLLLDGEGPPRRGSSIRVRGSDFVEGAPLIAAGDPLTPARIALAAIGGHGTLPARRRPRVTLISTGDELVAPGEPANGVMLPASNAPMLHAMIGAHADVTDAGLVPDRLDALVAAFVQAEADVIVTTGGASVGDHDLVRPALEQAGATLDFWRIAMRPGKPLLAGRLRNTIVLGLPGNPVSACVTARLFLLPLLARLVGARDPLPRSEPARLATALPQVGGRADYVRATLSDGEVTPVGVVDSAVLSALARADALIVRPAGAPPADVGETVDILRIT
jgi:molybdopterin molybdotransferase